MHIFFDNFFAIKKNIVTLCIKKQQTINKPTNKLHSMVYNAILD